MEAPVENLARDLLFLQMLTDYQVPIRQRANLFLEVFGNNMIQKRTSKYIESQGKKLKLLCAKGIGQLDQLLDLLA